MFELMKFKAIQINAPKLAVRLVNEFGTERTPQQINDYFRLIGEGDIDKAYRALQNVLSSPASFALFNTQIKEMFNFEPCLYCHDLPSQSHSSLCQQCEFLDKSYLEDFEE